MSLANIPIDMEIEVDPEIVLDGLTVKEVVDYLGYDAFLEEIGADFAIEYFGIEVQE